MTTESSDIPSSELKRLSKNYNQDISTKLGEEKSIEFETVPMLEAGAVMPNIGYNPQPGAKCVTCHQPIPVPNCNPKGNPQDGVAPTTGVRDDCPRGLEQLLEIESLTVEQGVDLLEVGPWYQSKNRFVVKNSEGQGLFHAVEDSECFPRLCCPALRPFELKMIDNSHCEIIRMERPFACDSCWFSCFLQKMKVYAPPGTLVGSVEQKWSVWRPIFSVKNEVGDTVLHIEGPLCTTGCGSDREFKVLSKDKKSVVGCITKKWGDLGHELISNSDSFVISFSMTMNFKWKTTLIGACFLIDAVFYEKNIVTRRICTC